MPAAQHIEQTAASWFLRLRELPQDAPERMDFERWLAASAQHQQAFADIEDTWQQLDNNQNLQKMAQAMQQKQTLAQAARHQKLQNGLKKLAAVCTIGLVTLLASQQYTHWQAQPVLQIARTNPVGTISSQTLDDGSQVILSANSQMQVTFYRKQRVVALQKGEAIFEVAKDAERPFIVQTDMGKVTVLGTRFAVNKFSHMVRVSVDHGKVQVEHANQTRILQDGQVAEITPQSAPTLAPRKAADAFEFAKGNLSFDKADIHEIAQTISRYRNTPVIAQGASKAQISAVVKTRDAEQFLQALPDIGSVQITNQPQQTIIRQK